MKNIFKFKSLIIFFLQNNTYLNKYIKIKIKLFIFAKSSIINYLINKILQIKSISLSIKSIKWSPQARF